MIKSYNELRRLKTFEERFDYLKLNGTVGNTTFGYDRYINQMLYKSDRWLRVRDKAIIRDEGCDLGVEGYEIYDEILVHHINPITLEDIENNSPIVFDLNNLITTTLRTHNGMHYGSKNPRVLPKERTRNDTCPWKK